MVAIVLNLPMTISVLRATDVGYIYIVNPVLAFCGFLWLGSAVATIQDCVLPRMRATGGAIFLLSLTLLGMALGPYACGRISDLTGSLRTGMLAMLLMAPVSVLLLWLASQGIGTAEATRVARAQAAGELST
jgi:hypothetical protein